MPIWIKLFHFHFSSLIPKMLMFNLVISCLITSNSPWYIHLTFQVPMKYCSLQHWILLSPLDTSTTEHCFCLGPETSFFSWAICNHSPLFPSSILETFWPGRGRRGGGAHFLRCRIFFFLFLVLMGFFQQEYCSGLLILLSWATFC